MEMPYMFVILGGLLLSVLYAAFRYWKRTHVTVHCWFCGLNSIIPKKCHDGWICKHCEQYNGFKQDGDYNRDIPAQWDSTLNGQLSFCSKVQPRNKLPSNGLCQECNRNQEMKVAQLASFQPINPENFDQEIENFRYHLERAYRLCPPCEAVLEETLSRKKTHVLDINLQMTGKKFLSGNHLSSKHIFQQSLAQTSSFLAITIALTLAASTIAKISSDHIVFKLYDLHSIEKTLPRHCTTPSVSPSSYLLSPPAVCPKQEVCSTPKATRILSGLLTENVETYLDLLGLYSPQFCVAALTLQGLSSWFSRRKFSLLLWVAFAGTEFFQQTQVWGTDFDQVSEVVQVIISLLILSFSWPVFDSHRSKLPTPVKKGAQGTSLKTKKWTTESLNQAAPNNTNVMKNQCQNAVQPIFTKTHSSGNIIQNGIALEAANYLTLPARSASFSSLHPPLSTISVAGDPAIPPPVDVRSTGTQEDTRSDGSVDSAFSNPDSITLDAADSLNSSYYIMGKKSDSQDDVHSLIESLSIGSLSSRRSVNNSSGFRTKPYGQELKRNSLLSPSRLSNIMNESISSGIWRNTGNYATSDVKTNATLTSASEIVADTTNRTLSRPSSPSESVRSQAAVQSVGAARGFLPSSSFQPVVTAWNSSQTPQSALSVCVPPNPLNTIAGFGSLSSPIPNSPMSQVIYTPYGLYHQMMGPFGNTPVFMMPPQSPPFVNRSPASSFGSQFSPRSFSTSSHFCDSDVDFSPKSTKGRGKSKTALSTSFLDSVWQSRFAIMYTTLCYLLLGSLVCAFSYSGVIPNLFYKILNWKQNVIS